MEQPAEVAPAAAAPDPAQVAELFVKFYYKTFDTNREDLASLYRENSVLDFQEDPRQGIASIMEKLTNLPFEQIEHQFQLNSEEIQVDPNQGLIFVPVTGKLLTGGEEHPLDFAQKFMLHPDGEGSYFVLQDEFRLVFPDQ